MAFTWLQDVYIPYGHQHGLTSFSVWNMRFIYLWHVERAHVHVSTNELQTAYVHRLIMFYVFCVFYGFYAELHHKHWPNEFDFDD